MNSLILVAYIILGLGIIAFAVLVFFYWRDRTSPDRMAAKAARAEIRRTAKAIRDQQDRNSREMVLVELRAYHLTLLKERQGGVKQSHKIYKQAQKVAERIEALQDELIETITEDTDPSRPTGK